MTWKPILSMAVMIWLTLRPSRSSASNIGAENRKVRRWEKFILCGPPSAGGRLDAPWPGASVAAGGPGRLLKTASTDRIKSAPRQDRGAALALPRSQVRRLPAPFHSIVIAANYAVAGHNR